MVLSAGVVLSAAAASAAARRARRGSSPLLLIEVSEVDESAAFQSWELFADSIESLSFQSWEFARNHLMLHVRLDPRLGKKRRKINALLRTHAPRQTALYSITHPAM
jgi:hypothetical protein